MREISKKGRLIMAVFALSLFTGCAATNTAISKRNLDVQTKMSATVFLDPVAPDLQTVYVQLRNSSDKEMNISGAVTTAIEQHGYRVVTDPNKAHYMLQANILSVGKMDPNAASMALKSGYGGALDGAAMGALAAGAGGSNGRGMAGFGLLGAVVGTVANAAVKDVTFTMITDLQISERAADGVIVNQAIQTNATQGTGTAFTQTSTQQTNWKRYRTRVVSTANKVNLDFAEARPALEHGLIRSISGVL